MIEDFLVKDTYSIMSKIVNNFEPEITVHYYKVCMSYHVDFNNINADIGYIEFSMSFYDETNKKESTFEKESFGIGGVHQILFKKNNNNVEFKWAYGK